MRMHFHLALVVCLVSGASAFAQRGDDFEDQAPRDRRARGSERGDDTDDRGSDRGRGDFGRGRDGGPGGFFRRPNPMFQAIDADGDGMISERELRRAAAALKTLDADNDGNISLAEASPQGGPGGPGGPFGDASQMVDRWMENDQNGDGKLTREEVPERMSFMLQNADRNGDGAVDKAELTAAAEEFGRRMAGGGGPLGGFGRGGDPQQWMQQIMQNDRNGDGRLSPDEVQGPAMAMLRGGDTNSDGVIDRAELEAIGRRMGERFGRGGPGGERGFGDRGFGDRGGRRDNGGTDDQDDRRSRRQRPETE